MTLPSWLYDGWRAEKLLDAVVRCLDAKEKEIAARILLHSIEAQAMLASIPPQVVDPSKKPNRGMMRAPFGYCPECGAEGIGRSKETGNDKCASGHYYQSHLAVMRSNLGAKKSEGTEP